MRSIDRVWEALGLVLRGASPIGVHCGLSAGTRRAQQGAELGQAALINLLQDAMAGKRLSGKKIRIFHLFLSVGGPLEQAVTWDDCWGLCDHPAQDQLPVRLVFQVVCDQPLVRDAIWRFLEAVARVPRAMHCLTPEIVGSLGPAAEA